MKKAMTLRSIFENAHLLNLLMCKNIFSAKDREKWPKMDSHSSQSVGQTQIVVVLIYCPSWSFRKKFENWPLKKKAFFCSKC